MGTTIRVCFRAEDRPAALPQGVERPQEGWRGTGTVLLVDDEAMVRTVVTQMLEIAGFSVLTAPDGVAAVELFRQGHDQIACVFLDLKMPRMDGVETFNELRKIEGRVPVVLTSGYSEEESTKRFGNKGLAGFIKKPYELAALERTLQAALDYEG
ncbi:MAG: response regulator [Deltaproteobacteria bacterium]|nr:response regulator [Deltaproteobacteria bacterium]